MADKKGLKTRPQALGNVDTNRLRGKGNCYGRGRKRWTAEADRLRNKKQVQPKEEDTGESKVEADGELTQFLGDNIRDSEPVSLDRQRVEQLQEDLKTQESKSANSANKCDHYLCSIANRKKLPNFRLWFLFELEVSYSGTENLRDCYYSQIYRKLDPSWKLENVFHKQDDSKDITSFSLGQVIIPETSFSPEYPHRNSECVSVHTQYPQESSAKISASFLSSRNKREVFDQQCVNAQDILNEKRGVTPFVESNLAGTENCCSLEKKLGMMHGLDLPEMKGN
ncbi:hypothetical protein HG535_0H01610 [Zygotorulaspora mrakii]|uniref:Uncharacterized protein n=1 Tax=Zygotorulaspora mrakii TaxID=42260 RepID=A0A7H9B980_ZYGMR|nr:uncharacterized protein HG535_0H01610 [Zygotorulaspora mrakii]QLG74834.1 hypothetical protein HG535_0H01610 [Zygotorulaspora mrakii]